MTAYSEFLEKQHRDILAMLKNDWMTYEEIARVCRSTAATVYLVAKRNGICRRLDRPVEGTKGKGAV